MGEFQFGRTRVYGLASPAPRQVAFKRMHVRVTFKYFNLPCIVELQVFVFLLCEHNYICSWLWCHSLDILHLDGGEDSLRRFHGDGGDISFVDCEEEIYGWVLG